MSGKRSRDKGAREERATVNALKAHGIKRVQRVPLSGASMFQKGDIIIDGLVWEQKTRRDGFRELYGWLGKDKAHGLILRANQRERLYVIPEHHMLDFFEAVGMMK